MEKVGVSVGGMYFPANKRELTKYDALMLCKELWTWLANNNTCRKYNWPRFYMNGGDIQRIVYDCPCCEYDKQQTTSRYRDVSRTCEYCPIDEWREKKSGNAGCTTNSSPFMVWHLAMTNGDFNKAKSAALGVIKLVDKNLTRLQKEDKIAGRCL